MDYLNSELHRFNDMDQFAYDQHRFLITIPMEIVITGEVLNTLIGEIYLN